MIRSKSGSLCHRNNNKRRNEKHALKKKSQKDNREVGLGGAADGTKGGLGDKKWILGLRPRAKRGFKGEERNVKGKIEKANKGSEAGGV